MKKRSFKELESNINLKGRAVFSQKDSLLAQMTASGFEFKADFSGVVELELNWSGETGMIGIVVDGALDSIRTILVGPEDQKVKLGEFYSVHTLKIVKLNEFNRNFIEFLTLEFEGELLERPPEKDLKFEFFGDSLTCGYGNLCENRDEPNPFCEMEHGYLTWCSFLADTLGAEFSVAAISGQGLLRDCSGNPEGIIDKYWDLAVSSPEVKWDFNRFVADYVFVNFGTNDINYLKNSNNEFEFQNYFDKTCWLVESIRSKNKNAVIIFAIGHDMSNLHYKSLSDVYAKVCETYANVYLFDDLKNNQLGGNWHPNVDDHKMMFNTLLGHMTKVFGLK